VTGTDTLLRRFVPGLDRSVCRFVLGTIPLARPTPDEAVALIRHALGRGVDVIDTARVYGPAEAYVGRALRDVPGADDVVVTTKSVSRDGDGLRRDLETSLANLGRRAVDVFFLHQVDSFPELDAVLAPNGALAAVQRARDEGLVGKIGLSGHFTPVLVRVLETMDLDVLLGRFNLTMTDDEAELVAGAHERGMAVATMKVYEGGFVTKHTDLALRFAVHHPGLDLVMIGCETVEQVDGNLAAFTASRPLADDEEQRLRTAAEALRSTTFCSYCGYCTAACPKALPVAHVFNLEGKLQVYGDDYGFQGSPGAAMYVSEFLSAIDACDECGACEERCPNRLPIRRLLKERRARLQACLDGRGDEG